MSIFTDELKALCPYLTDDKLSLMEKYFICVVEKNKVMNLTRITDEKAAAKNHFYDSLTAAKALPQNAKVLDIGTGGGFPGVPLKISRPDISLTMIDSVGKKIDFVKEATRSLGIQCDTIAVRAEEFCNAKTRESFDIVVSRAVADLRILCELALPFVKTGGYFLAYKSNFEEELENAKPAIKATGGKTEKVLDFGNHSIILIKKISSADKKYPRRYSQILKNKIL